MKRIVFPLNDKNKLRELRAGEEVLLDGVIYTARDRVHKMAAEEGAEWPFELEGSAIYYCGPTPARPGFPLGSCGPTTSARMDVWTPGLYRKGVAATIGKGPRGSEVVSVIRETGGVYFAAYGGCGALYALRVKEASPAAYPELGAQAVFRVRVEGFPVLVGIDSEGESIFRGDNI